uniref:E3 ubiquitin protein ligase RIE1-like n=1 Tax=Crassostrea virginica TaxID=6565 RepID=A0A8B8EIN2_CRAVI|nr:E3 ubiquitin protein ligase RIE1-like [Crassostrea virginica]XP_022339388.1 E3 ubiquitin protein ligase RIE1-like [Crassostrea virginica]
MAEGIRYNIVACAFWIIAVATVVCSASFASVCLIGIGGCCYEDTCTLLETATICLVIGSLMMTFCHCYRQKLKNESSPSFYVESMNLSPDTNINTHYSPVPVNIVTKVEELREDLLKAVPETDIPEDFECAICNEGHTDEVSQLSCNHFFHKGCVLQWFLSNSQHTCPICRSSQIPANHLLIITVLPAISARPTRTSQL